MGQDSLSTSDGTTWVKVYHLMVVVSGNIWELSGCQMCSAASPWLVLWTTVTLQTVDRNRWRPADHLLLSLYVSTPWHVELTASCILKLFIFGQMFSSGHRQVLDITAARLLSSSAQAAVQTRLRSLCPSSHLLLVLGFHRAEKKERSRLKTVRLTRSQDRSVSTNSKMWWRSFVHMTEYNCY